MFNTVHKSYPFNNDPKFNFQAILGITGGIFLFLIFFLPLNPTYTDFNKKILTLAGFALIILFFLVLLRIIFPAAFPKTFRPEKWSVKKEIMLHLLFLIFNSVGFAFFARYVGRIMLTFHLVVNIVLLSLAATLILVLINDYQFLKKQIKNLLNQEDAASEAEQEAEKNALIEFVGENQSETFQLFPEQIILIRAASNYIEIIYKQQESTHHRLFRSTLKTTEKQLSGNPSFVRCHRSCIVNINYIREVVKNPGGLKLKLFNYPREIKVSRQYVLKIKEHLNTPV